MVYHKILNIVPLLYSRTLFLSLLYLILCILWNCFLNFTLYLIIPSIQKYMWFLYFGSMSMTLLKSFSSRFLMCLLEYAIYKISSVQFSPSVVSNSLQPHGPQHTRPPCPSPLPEFTQTHVHWVGDAIQPSHLLSSLSPPPSIFPRIRVFSNEWVLHIRWSKYWSCSFNINPFNGYSGLISFRMGWLDLLAVWGTLKSLPQHHNSKASVLQH